MFAGCTRICNKKAQHSQTILSLSLCTLYNTLIPYQYTEDGGDSDLLVCASSQEIKLGDDEFKKIKL